MHITHTHTHTRPDACRIGNQQWLQWMNICSCHVMSTKSIRRRCSYWCCCCCCWRSWWGWKTCIKFVDSVCCWSRAAPLHTYLPVCCVLPIVLEHYDVVYVCRIRRISTLFWQSVLRFIGRVSYIRISLYYFCFRWKTVSLIQGLMQHLMHHVTVSRQQSKITLQNNCIKNTSITQPTLSFYLWLKM